jgi:Stigma-specific protein, Stig1
LASVPGGAWARDRCSEGQTRCGDRCVNLQTNERHCGSCRNRCGSKQTCCGGRCVNLKRSERHCGRCSNRCAEGEECDHGVCSGGGGCPPGETVCTGCACETVACTPDTFGCNPNALDPDGGVCRANADGVGTTCVCGFGHCTNDCSECTNEGAICVSSQGCAADFGLPFQCVGPCTPAAICDPPCPANCSCDFAADGTTICTDTFALIRIEEGGCELCMNEEVCLAGRPGFVGCTSACPVA